MTSSAYSRRTAAPWLQIGRVMRGTVNAAQYQAFVFKFAGTWINLS
jgi:hypothetical protein